MTLTPAFLPDDDISGLTADPRVAQALQDHDEGKIGYIRLLRVVRSVVAAEEGRKYEALAKLVKEWQAATEAHTARVAADNLSRDASDTYARLLEAEDALAQWEAL